MELEAVILNEVAQIRQTGYYLWILATNTLTSPSMSLSRRMGLWLKSEISWVKTTSTGFR
jgi:N6-adenosine-specific RNA methylase IME4